MKYTQPSFSVPGSAGSKAECDRVGHTEPDRHGKCLRCAERVGPVGELNPEISEAQWAASLGPLGEKI